MEKRKHSDSWYVIKRLTNKLKVFKAITAILVSVLLSVLFVVLFCFSGGK
jgi:hypothetical protein